MTPTLRFLERRLPIVLARFVLTLIYAAMLISITALTGPNWFDPILYVNVQ